MKNATATTGIITRMERVRNSKHGNPRFSITLKTGDNVRTYLTPPNSMASYALSTSLVGSAVRCVVGTHYRVDTIRSIERIESVIPSWLAR